MEYVDGVCFDEIDSQKTSHFKSKVFTMFYLFTRDMILVKNFNHGDLHSSNWKVQVDTENKIGFKLVIYDFGYCWEMEKGRENLVHKSTDLFESVDDIPSEEHLNEFAYIFYESIEHDHISDKQALKQHISEYIRNTPELGNRKRKVVLTPYIVYRVVNRYCKCNGIRMSAELIQYVILYTQLLITCSKYGFATVRGTAICDHIYKERYTHCLNYCKTYNI